MGWLIAALLGFLTLHDPGGGRVFVNPNSISSLREPAGKARWPHGTHCVLTLSSGGSIAVREDCDAVRSLLAPQDQR